MVPPIYGKGCIFVRKFKLIYLTAVVQEEDKYTFEEVLQQTLDYFGGDEFAARVWANKYALRDAQGNYYEKSPVEMHHRLARELARIESGYPNPLTEETIFSLLDHFKYVVPAGSAMMGIGNDFQLSSLSNCFVIGQEGDSDSYGAIMKTDEEQAQLMKRRGGVGHDLSHYRPFGLPISNSAVVSTGIVPFMERFSNTANEVAQKGRRGALMLSLSVRHPDAERFMDAKLQLGHITGANLSLRLDDTFMQAVEKGGNYVQQYPVDVENPQVRMDADARTLWKKLVHNAWQSAEPGVLFWDTILKESIADCYTDKGFGSITTNSCGEIPLSAYDSCRLLSLNLYSYVVNPFTRQSRFNFELFRQHAVMAQRLLDDMVDLEREKISRILQKIDADPQGEELKRTERELWQKIDEKCAKGRRTGLGVTGEGDMLAAMGLRYGSEEATGFAVNIHRTLAVAAYSSSVSLARERGAFELYDAVREQKNPFILRMREADSELYKEMTTWGRRNIACLTIAPTGTASLMTQTTSGMEPVYRMVYSRRRQVDSNAPSSRIDYVDEEGNTFEEYNVFHHHFQTWMRNNGYDVDKTYSKEEMDELAARSPYARSTADTVDWLGKVKMQGAIQKWVDHSISTTVNIPNEATEDLVDEIYFTAWKSGCKGCTVYREGSREAVLLDKDKEHGSVSVSASMTVVETRPQVLECDVVRFQNNKDKWVAFVGLLDGYPYEIFTGLQDDDEGIVLPKSVTRGRIIKNTNRDGSHRYDFQFENKRGYKTTVEGLSEKFNKEYWNYAKLISGVLRYRMPLNRVLKLVGSLQLGDENINTWKVGVERALKKYTKGNSKGWDVCPVCGHHSFSSHEGRMVCSHCGVSL